MTVVEILGGIALAVAGTLGGWVLAVQARVAKCEGKSVEHEQIRDRIVQEYERRVARLETCSAEIHGVLGEHGELLVEVRADLNWLKNSSSQVEAELRRQGLVLQGILTTLNGHYKPHRKEE